MSDSYRTVLQSISSRFKEKGSKFIGHIQPAASRNEAEAQIEEMKNAYHDATHNCSAYRIGLGDDAQFHYDDDGEPSGTAGKPIYQVIEGAELTNVVVIVTRYFGGTKLGTGGLIRAYGAAAKMVIDNADVVEKVLAEKLHVRSTYDDMNLVMRAIDTFNGKLIEQEYSDLVKITLAVPRSKTPEIEERLREQSAGRITIVRDNIDG